MADPSTTTAQGQDQGISLPVLFRRALESASEAYNLPTIEEKTQDLIKSSIRDLKNVSSRISALSLFSANETLEDLATKDMVYLFVPYALSEVNSRLNVGSDPEDRLRVVAESQASLKRFLKLLSDYEIVSDADRSAFDPNAAAALDPGRRREVKIAQSRKQKEIKDRIKALRQRKGGPAGDFPDDFDLVASLLPGPTRSGDDDDDDDLDDEMVREMTLLLLRLIWTQAISNLTMIDQEVEMLRHALRNPPPPRPPQTERSSGAAADTASWRLDRLPGVGSGPDGKGPLLDAQGKPLRTFTIVSGQQADRARLQAEVFRPDHRLPTMSIDEYLEEEKRRGNIITGGGAASQNAPTSSEQLQMDSEQDGTIFGEQKSEEKRKKDEEWAVFTDRNPKGSGNTMNRG
ncbi:hypothetical protein FRC04_009216 [Tulasnella sp. 424]|nr:hypothetical protein FRC04_009216 [Tulasnella sp. 424]KAG8973573.1 hypothetical protein FRC05_008641 [Tulasnella sp. 425]